MTDTDFAEFVSLYLEGSWVWCPNSKEGIWYHFNRSLWVPQRYNEVIRRIVSTKIVTHLMSVMGNLTQSELSMVLDSTGNVVDVASFQGASGMDTNNSGSSTSILDDMGTDGIDQPPRQRMRGNGGKSDTLKRGSWPDASPSPSRTSS